MRSLNGLSAMAIAAAVAALLLLTAGLLLSPAVAAEALTPPGWAIDRGEAAEDAGPPIVWQDSTPGIILWQRDPYRPPVVAIFLPPSGYAEAGGAVPYAPPYAAYAPYPPYGPYGPYGHYGPYGPYGPYASGHPYHSCGGYGGFISYPGSAAGAGYARDPADAEYPRRARDRAASDASGERGAAVDAYTPPEPERRPPLWLPIPGRN
jgi:hypothetical protein